MASRRFRGRSSSRDRFERREGTFEKRERYGERDRFRQFNVVHDEPRQRDDREAALSARDRIRLENQAFDRKLHRSSSRTRSTSEHAGRILSREHSSHRSRSPRKRDYNDDRSGRNGNRSVHSKEKSSRRHDGGSINRKEEKLRFEPPNHRFEEFKDEREGRFESFHGEEGSFVGNRFSPPHREDFHEDNVEIELRTPHYSREGFVEYTGPGETTGSSESGFRDKVISQSGNLILRQNTSPIIDRQGFIPNQNNSFVDNSSQLNISGQMKEQQFQDADGPLIPEFNPEQSKLSSYDWIMLIEETARKNEWQKDEKQYVLASRLAGYARQWYLTTGVQYKSWRELRFAFLQAFPSEMDYCKLLQKMLARVKEDNESMATYFHHKVVLLNACEIHGSKAVSCIIAGLPGRQNKLKARAQNFEDPDELYMFLRSIDEKETTPQVNKRCYTCKEVGHLRSQCPKKLHKEENPTAVPLALVNKVMYGSLSHMSTEKKCFTEVNINGVTLNAYVDPKSDCTTIRQSAANNLKLPVKKEYKLIKGFAGNSFSSVGVVEVPLCIDKAIANVQLSVIPDHIQAIPMIIGRNFVELPQIMFMKDGEKVRFYQRLNIGKAF